MKTICVQIGNSDNKLTQEEWARFTEQVNEDIRCRTWETHFNGSSDSRSQYQNACWVFEIEDEYVFALKQELRSTGHYFHQTSIAFMEGETEFI